jgi:hypothetical protein
MVGRGVGSRQYGAMNFDRCLTLISQVAAVVKLFAVGRMLRH